MGDYGTWYKKYWAKVFQMKELDVEVSTPANDSLATGRAAPNKYCKTRVPTDFPSKNYRIIGRFCKKL